MLTDTTDCESVAKSDDLLDDIDDRGSSRLSEDELKEDIEKVQFFRNGRDIKVVFLHSIRLYSSQMRVAIVYYFGYLGHVLSKQRPTSVVYVG